MSLYDRLAKVNPSTMGRYQFSILWKHPSGLPFVYLRKQPAICRMLISGMEQEQALVTHWLAPDGCWKLIDKQSYLFWSLQWSTLYTSTAN